MERNIDKSILKKIEKHKYTPAEIIFRLKEFIKLKNATDEEIMAPFIQQ